jgi:UDP-N-acetylmuramate dehydrogenase
MSFPSHWQRNVSLAEYTSMKLGGKAEFFCEVETREQLISCFEYAKSNGIFIHLLGGGTNLVISDSGLMGLTIRVKIKENGTVYRKDKHGNRTFVTVDCGETWDDFVAHVCKRGLYGIECMSGIPGTVGAAPVQNIGAYGQELTDTIQAVEIFSPESKNIFWVEPAFLKLRYRSSILKMNNLPAPYVVTAIRLALHNEMTEFPSYPELNARLRLASNDSNRKLTPQDIRENVLDIRRGKSMVMDDRDPWSKSCGSFFTNPVLSSTDGERLQNLAMQKGWPEIPMYLTSDFRFKVPAAKLIELSGLTKGFSMGTACISEKHALAIVNRGESAQDVHKLCRHIQSQVQKKFGVTLEPEPQFWGNFRE